MADAVAARVPLGATMPLRQKLVLMAALVLCLFLTALDQSIVATAIPHILADLQGFTLLSWIITVYLLASTVTIPIAGKLSDMFGRRDFLIGGVAVFVASSAACGAAPTMLALIAARGVQGIGAGLIISCVFGTLGDLFTPIERAKYFALTVGGFTFASLAGPAVGGFLADGPGWRWSFYINLPIGIAAAWFIVQRLPRGGGAGGRASQVDFLGATLLAAGTISFLMGIVWASAEFGWGSPQTIGLLVAAVILAVAFVVQEGRATHAIIPLDLFRNVAFSKAIAITVVQSGGIFAATQFLPTFVQTSLGGSATASGVVVTPQAIGLLGTSIISGQLVSRTGHFKRQTTVGAIAMLAAAFAIMHVGINTSQWQVAGAMVVMGLGGGLVFPVTQVVVQASVAQDRQGIAASTRQFFNQIAQTVGAAMFGLILTSGYQHAFAANTASIATQIPTAAYQQLQDPTVALNPEKFSLLTAEFAAVPNGAALLDRATLSQRESVAAATDHMYVVVLGAAAVICAVTLGFREIPLRRSFDAAEAIVEA